MMYVSETSVNAASKVLIETNLTSVVWQRSHSCVMSAHDPVRRKINFYLTAQSYTLIRGSQHQPKLSSHGRNPPMDLGNILGSYVDHYGC